MENIRVNGLIEPIVLHEGMILDGRNRYRALRELDHCITDRQSDPELFCDYSGLAADALEWVVSKNLHRRHRNESQRAMVGAQS